MFPACAVVEAACEIYHPGYPKKKSRFSAKRSKLCVKVFLGRDLFFSWNYILQSNKCDFCAYSGTLIKRPPGKLQ